MSVWQWSSPGTPSRPPAPADPADRDSSSPAGDDEWDHGLRGLLTAAAGRPAPAEPPTFSVLQLMPADLAHGVLAVGRAAHGFVDEASASEHALCRGWRGFAVLPSRHLPPTLHPEVRQDGI